MNTKLLLLGFLATNSVACVVHRNDYNVILDPQFSDNEYEKALSGIDDWTSKIPELTLNPVIGACSGRVDATICVHASTGAEVASHAHKSIQSNGQPPIGYTDNSDGHPEDWMEGIDGAEIWIAMDWVGDGQKDENDFRAVVEHEIGHGMSMVHHNEHGNLMALDHTNWETYADCDDVAQFYQIRGRDVPACKIGEGQ